MNGAGGSHHQQQHRLRQQQQQQQQALLMQQALQQQQYQSGVLAATAAAAMTQATGCWNIDQQGMDDHEGVHVVGFEAPPSPESSSSGNEGESVKLCLCTLHLATQDLRESTQRAQAFSGSRRRPTSTYMPPRSYQLLLFLVILELACVAIAASGEDVEYAACVAANRTDAAWLRADRLTVILTGYSERRLPLLRAIAGAYAAHPLVLAVVVLWCNPSTPDRRLLGGAGFPPRAVVRRAASASLNSRFLPRPSDVRTAAVAVADDDVLPDAAALSFAFAAWQQQQRPVAGPGPLVGFFPRSHHLDLARRRWAYTAAQPGRYSMVLTKLMVLGTDLLRAYSCSPDLAAARAVVDRERNCEDILMNFVAVEASGAGPVLVEAGGVRDWGDPRNDAAGEGPRGGARDVGLSATGGLGHWETRGRCITEFHRLLGRMPLRYSYDKLVQATGGEQGLCSKGGRLVRCDQG